jgi:hypothetical protein
MKFKIFSRSLSLSTSELHLKSFDSKIFMNTERPSLMLHQRPFIMCDLMKFEADFKLIIFIKRVHLLFRSSETRHIRKSKDFG